MRIFVIVFTLVVNTVYANLNNLSCNNIEHFYGVIIPEKLNIGNGSLKLPDESFLFNGISFPLPSSMVIRELYFSEKAFLDVKMVLKASGQDIEFTVIELIPVSKGKSHEELFEIFVKAADNYNIPNCVDGLWSSIDEAKKTFNINIVIPFEVTYVKVREDLLLFFGAKGDLTYLAKDKSGKIYVILMALDENGLAKYFK